MRDIWRGMSHVVYGRLVPRRTKTDPVRRPAALEGWEGHWVALRGDEVIAAAWNPRELTAKLHEMGPSAAGAVARYVPYPSADIVIGVG